jgi:isoleucyl-tRNA synthetase
VVIEEAEAGGEGEYPPIGADVIRWLYCRSNPAAEHQFWPWARERTARKFHMKLFHSYAFFCNYARLAGNPTAERVPKGWSVMDRWILSDLQKLIKRRGRRSRSTTSGVLPGGGRSSMTN